MALGGRETRLYTRQTLKQTIILGSVIYTLFAGLDWLLYPEHVGELWAIRFGFALPMTALIFYLSQRVDYFLDKLEPLIALWLTGVGVSIIAQMLVLESDGEHTYYAGLVLVLFFTYTIKGFNLFWASLTGALVVILYELAAIFWLEMTYNQLVVSTFIMVAANFMGMGAMRNLNGFESRILDISYRDPLTGIANRRAYDEYLQSQLERLGVRRQQKPLSLLLLDIDFFKSINDNDGHPVGDSCLVQLARCLDDSFSRHADLVARIGGDEFAVILPGTDEEGAEALAAAALDRVRALEMACGEESRRVTTSMGLVTLHPGEICEQEMVYGMADRALMQAKSAGRDCLFVYQRSAEDCLDSLA